MEGTSAEGAYPKTERYRAHKDQAFLHAEHAFAYFKDNFPQAMEKAFGAGYDLGTLTADEKQDIFNFFEHASKRVAAGAVSSPAYHEKILSEKNLSSALDYFLPLNNLSHDGMHAAVAYRQSKGASLTPAYERMEIPEEASGRIAEDRKALLEEAAVNAFWQIDSIRSALKALKEKQGSGDPVMEVVHDYEERYGVKDVADDERNPAMVEFVRAVWDDMQSEVQDRNLSVHEFLKMTKPLLERLRVKKATLS